MTPIDAKREALRRAQGRGDLERAATIRGELLRLHRRAMRRALALDDLEALAMIQREMAADLEPVTALQAATCGRALLLDMGRERSRWTVEAVLGPFELERMQRRAERYVSISSSADDAVRIVVSLRDENALAEFFRCLIGSNPGVMVTADLSPETFAMLDAQSDAIAAFDSPEGAWAS